MNLPSVLQSSEFLESNLEVVLYQSPSRLLACSCINFMSLVQVKIDNFECCQVKGC